MEAYTVTNLRDEITPNNDDFCRMCQFPASDLQVSPCGCTMHARCVPVELIVPNPKELRAFSESRFCPCCKSGPLTRIEMYASSAELIDRAVDIRRQSEHANNMETSELVTSLPKRNLPTIKETCTSIPESSYLLLSSTYNPMEEVLQSSPFWDTDFHRTGRWTSEEVSYVDFLISAFEQGSFPIPNGISLKEFLCHKLLCRGSRLTKKLKKAKLSSRTFEIQYPETNSASKLDVVSLSALQETFLQSIRSDTTQLAVRFYISKSWKSLLSNLCTQVNFNLLDVTKWLTSVEDMDKKAAYAEEIIRSERRKSAAIKLKTQVGQSQFANVATSNTKSQPLPPPMRFVNVLEAPSKRIKPDVDVAQSSLGSTDVLEDNIRGKMKSNINDFADVFDDSVERSHSLPALAMHTQGNIEGTMLKALYSLLQQNNIPFHYAEMWVPSYGPPSSPIINTDIQLHHGGYTYRHDLHETTQSCLTSFGEFRATLTLSPGEGIPGTSFLCRSTQWRCDIRNEADMLIAGTDHMLQTAVSIPIVHKMSQNVVLVIIFFGLTNIPEDKTIIRHIEADLSRYSPKPKWTTVVDVGTSPINMIDHAADGSVATIASMKESMVESYHAALPNIVDASSAGDKSPFDVGTNTEHNPKTDRDDEIIIANLISHHMPNPLLNVCSKAEAVSIQDCISLRLLLLRPSQSRSEQEKMVIELIRHSYSGYRQSHRWTDHDIFLLIIKDWISLRESSL